MKAVRVFAGGDIRLVDVAVPEPADAEVRIRVEAVGICGTDIEIVGGNMAYYTAGLARYPVTIGHEWTGIIDAVGVGVQGLQLGQRVVGEVSIGCMTCPTCRSGAYHRCVVRTETGVMNRDGGMAEHLVLPAWAVHLVPSEVDVRAAALIEPTAIAYNAVRLGGIAPGRRVLIVGDGPIGLLILLVARAFGGDGLVLCGADSRRLELARSLGAAAVIDAREPDVAEHIVAAFEGERPEIVLEASGSLGGVETAIALAAPGATIVLQGLLGRLPERGLDLDRIVVNDLCLRGALGSPGIWPQVVELVASGLVDPALLVTHDLPMEDFANAFGLVRSREAIKVILRPHHE
jgi:L-iditol 2-dehydrogenase